MVIINILKTMFAYPYGIVLGNLIASAMTGSIVVIRNEVHHKRTQRLLKERNNSNGRSDA